MLIKKVLVLYTGGAIGMVKDENGAVSAPTTHRFVEQVKTIPHMYNEDFIASRNLNENLEELIIPKLLPGKTIVAYVIEVLYNHTDTANDTNNMRVEKWVGIAKKIEENYSKYDGFAILVDINSLIYTASALSFILGGLQKSVILTASKRSIFEDILDSEKKLFSSVSIAGCHRIPEISVLMGGKVMRGNRVSYCHTNLGHGFSSPGWGILAETENLVKVYPENFMSAESKIRLSWDITVHTNLNSHIIFMQLFPTIPPEMFQGFFDPDNPNMPDGMILQCYNIYDGLLNRLDLLYILKEIAEKDILIIVLGLCPKEPVRSSGEIGRILEEYGLLPGYDMTPEAATMKLSYVLGQPCPFQRKKQLMVSDLRGEMTIEKNKGG